MRIVLREKQAGRQACTQKEETFKGMSIKKLFSVVYKSFYYKMVRSRFTFSIGNAYKLLERREITIQSKKKLIYVYLYIHENPVKIE